MNSNNKGRKLLQILVIAAFAVYNYSSLISINSITDRLSYIESKIALAKFQSSKIPDLLATNKKNINYAGVFKTTIGYSTVISKSHSNRKSIHEFNPGHLVAKNYDSVALAINRYISNTKKSK